MHRNQVGTIFELSLPESIFPACPYSPSMVATGQRQKEALHRCCPTELQGWSAMSSSATKTSLVNHSEVSAKTKPEKCPGFWRGD